MTRMEHLLTQTCCLMFVGGKHWVASFQVGQLDLVILHDKYRELGHSDLLSSVSRWTVDWVASFQEHNIEVLKQNHLFLNGSMLGHVRLDACHDGGT